MESFWSLLKRWTCSDLVDGLTTVFGSFVLSPFHPEHGSPSRPSLFSPSRFFVIAAFTKRCGVAHSASMRSTAFSGAGAAGGGAAPGAAAQFI
jgi:hypothetical protein